MDDLGFPDRHHARAADGWLELGDPVEAARELTALSEPARRHPDVLEICWRLHVVRRDWEGAGIKAHQIRPDSLAQLARRGWIGSSLEHAADSHTARGRKAHSLESGCPLQ